MYSDQSRGREYHRYERRRPREVPQEFAAGWLEGKKKWLALLLTGAAFVMVTRHHDNPPPLKTDSPSVLVEPETEDDSLENQQSSLAFQLAELAKINDALEEARARAGASLEPEQPPKEPDPYEPFLALADGDIDFTDFHFVKQPDGTYMIAPKDNVLEFSGVEVRREEDGTFTLGTASGFDSAINISADELKKTLLAKMEISKLYRQRIASESPDGAKAVGEAIVETAHELNLPLSATLVKDKLGLEEST